MRKSRRTRGVTILDVAREAGVSPATVSRVLNNQNHVREDKRARVLNAITLLGYVVNQQARSLAGGRSQVIGLLVHEIGVAYTGEVIRGVEDTLAAANYDLMLYTTHRRKTRESVYVETLTRGMTDGLLLLLPLNAQAYLDTLHREQFPFVVIDYQGVDDFSSTVIARNHQAAFDATRYLIQLGHRRIGFIAGDPETSSAVQRLEGYKAALKEHGRLVDEALVANGDFRQLGGYQAAGQLLALPDPPTAIFAANDHSAFGAMDAARDHGLAVPRDISIIGFDDIPQAAVVRPALTTVRQPLVEMGRSAARMLLELIENPSLPPRRVELDTQFVIRETCGPSSRETSPVEDLVHRR